MKTQIFISVIFILAFFSCKNNRTQEKPKQETPKALEDVNSSFGEYSKRNNDDLVENLYYDIVSNDLELKNLEDKINILYKSKNDSVDLFNKYNGKNESYFSSADRVISEINDSLLQNKIKNLIALQLSKYDSKIARHNELLKIIESNQVKISDLYNVLKIIRTLPLIDKYQKDNLPNTSSLEGYIKQQEEAIKLTDSLSKK